PRSTSCLPTTIHSTSLFFFLRIPHPPKSTLFPYTTLFRSSGAFASAKCRLRRNAAAENKALGLGDVNEPVVCSQTTGSFTSPKRSEEHTSELQSQSNLVCRLLLEKKKKKKKKESKI